MNGKVTEKNVIQHEFIGLHASIIETGCETLKNISGQIIDETMNTFKLEYRHDGKLNIIIVPKHGTTFRFTLPRFENQPLPMTVDINGTILTKRPEDRIKKLAKIAKRMKLE